MTSSTNRIHAMYTLLQECGEDSSCGCGCDGEDELDEKPKAKPKKKMKESIADTILALLDEARKRRRSKVRVRTFRNIAQVRSLKSSSAPKVRSTPNAVKAVRSGVKYNRHRR